MQQPQADKPKSKASKYTFMLINNKYKTGQIIGSGGYGYVYYAQDYQGRRYAIKISDLNPSNKPQSKVQQIIRCLDQQDQSMMVCNSEFVVKCYEAMKDSTQHLKFIVMQLCNLGSLEDLIYLKGHLTEQEARIIFKQTLLGLFQMHMKGRIHRDIKASNVCFHEDHCVLCDFGCSKEFLTSEERKNWSRTIKKNGTVMGTILSKSPEMLRKQQYGFKSELWGMGILFYQMLTGVPPFLFDKDLTDQEALKFIETNIAHIYEENYVKQNLNKYNMVDRGNYKLSDSALGFLQKLLVIDQNQRVGWQALIKEEYLLQENRQFTWDIAECSLPLKDVDWKEYCQRIQGREYKKIEADHNQKDQHTVIEVRSQPLQKIEKSYIGKRCKQKIKNQNDAFNLIKIVHFEIRRVGMLTKFRTFLYGLEQQRNLQSGRVGFLLSKYCYFKSLEIEEKVIKNQIKLFSNFDIRKLVELLKPKYAVDRESFINRYKKGFMNSIKSILFATKTSQQYMQVMLNQSIQSVYECIKDEIQILYDKVKSTIKSLNHQYLQFFTHPLEILKAEYQPEKETSIWRQWKTLGCIFEYVAQNH